MRYIPGSPDGKKADNFGQIGLPGAVELRTQPSSSREILAGKGGQVTVISA